jgi:uncharacterized Zn-binding protein involved in type VI secretion
MPSAAAKKGDKIVCTDAHLVQGTLVPVPFSGSLNGELSKDVRIEHRWAAMVNSTAKNDKPHEPPKGKAFDKPPTNRGVIIGGSGTVRINNRAAARDCDPAQTCNDPDDLPIGVVVAKSTVIVGG